MNSGSPVLLENSNFIFLDPRGVSAHRSLLEEIDAVQVFHGIQPRLGVAVCNLFPRFTHVNVKACTSSFGEF